MCITRGKLRIYLWKKKKENIKNIWRFKNVIFAEYMIQN